MKKAGLIAAICLVVLLTFGVGLGSAYTEFAPSFSGFPNSVMWFFDDIEWSGFPGGNHAVAAVDYDYEWLWGAELNQYGETTAYYVWDMITNDLWIGIDYGSYVDWTLY